jgi:hypothetical protein
MAGAAMTPGAHIEVLVRGEWIAVEVTHVPLEAGHSYIGRTRAGFKLSWPTDAEMRAGVGATIAERVELREANERVAAIDAIGRRVAGIQNDRIMALEGQLDEARKLVAGLEGRCAGLEMRALLAEEEREEWRVTYGALAMAVEMQDGDLAAALDRAAQFDMAATGKDADARRYRDMAEQAYTIGRRDGMAVAAHRSELVRDVIEAARAYANPALHGDAYMAAGRALEKALDVLIEAERAKEGA